MPSRAIAIPVEQITTYFHAASTAARVRRCPTRKAVTIVVASTATHSRPRLEASTASAMAERNTWTSALCRVAVRVSARPALISAAQVRRGGRAGHDCDDGADHQQHERAQGVRAQQSPGRGAGPGRADLR